jgi:hypothetical protein
VVNTEYGDQTAVATLGSASMQPPGSIHLIEKMCKPTGLLDTRSRAAQHANIDRFVHAYMYVPTSFGSEAGSQHHTYLSPFASSINTGVY